MPLELTPCLFAETSVVVSPYASFAPRLAPHWAEQCDVRAELAAGATAALIAGKADGRVAIQTVEPFGLDADLAREPFGEAWLHALLVRTAEVTESSLVGLRLNAATLKCVSIRPWLNAL